MHNLLSKLHVDRGDLWLSHNMVAWHTCLITLLTAGACGGGDPPAPGRLEPIFSIAPSLSGCALASPLLGPGDRIIAVASDGEVSAVDPVTGARAWTLHLPVEEGQGALVLATPIRIDDLMVVAYQRVVAGRRVAHTVSVVDLALGRIHPDFPTVTLAATGITLEGDPVPFNPPTQASRAALARIDRRVYVSLGNIQDIQPWHGWLFELDLDAWRAGGSAISAVLPTTPETDCGTPGTSGSRERQCGGGIWAPAGPQVFGGELLVPTGNGQLDIPRRDYANGLLRVGPGLEFDPGCDGDCLLSTRTIRPRAASIPAGTCLSRGCCRENRRSDRSRVPATG